MKAKIIEANEVGSLNEDQIIAVESAIGTIKRNESFENKKLYNEIKKLGLYHIRSKGILIIAIRQMGITT